MKKILGIVGSKRSSGNCEVMVKQISRQVSEPHELTLLRLPDFDLKFCTGCYRCLLKRKPCVLRDDLSLVLEAIADADALILAVPTYFLAAHSCLKLFLDRAISFYGMGESLWGKPAVGVGIAGIPGKEGSTLLDIERFFATLFARNRQSSIVYGALPGEVLLDNRNLDVAAQMGRALFGQPERKSTTCCPRCGGETFRFLEDGQVRCMLCSNIGTISQNGGAWEIEVGLSEHDLLANEEEAVVHRDWLLSTVERFKKEKQALRDLGAGYEDETPWVSPKR